MPEEATLPPGVLTYLVRTLPPRALWDWLSEEEHWDLRNRVVKGFRATVGVLRQPASRSRLASHLEHNADDRAALVWLWSETSPPVIAAIQERDDDGVLIAALPALQTQFGYEALHLALFGQDREAVLENWIEKKESKQSDENNEFAAAVSTPSPEDAAPKDESKAQLARIARLEKQLQNAQNKLAAERGKLKASKVQIRELEKAQRGHNAEQERFLLAAQRETKAAQQRELGAQEKYAAAQKMRERAERHEKHSSALRVEALSELKTFKRQAHRLGQIAEDLRRELALRDTHISELEKELKSRPSLISSEAKEETQSTPSESEPQFSFEDENGQLRRWTKHEVFDAIDHGDEKKVFTIVALLEKLKLRDDRAYRVVIRQAKSRGRYYAAVLGGHGKRVLVDASNVARYEAEPIGQIEYLTAMKSELQRAGYFPIIFIADASLRFHIDSPQALQKLAERGEVVFSRSGQEADELLARRARETGAPVITNDRNFHRNLPPDYVPRRIGFTIVGDAVILK